MTEKALLSNEAQERVIQHIDGPMIVVACPGSGKTTTLLRRIHYMITEKRISPGEILMITFTKAAAKEMGARYAKLFGENPGVTFCTIHSLCLAIVKTFTEYTAENLVRDPGEYIFETIRKNDKIRDKGSFIADALTDISIVKNNHGDLSAYNPKCCKDRALFRTVYNAYVDGLKKDNLIDYDDMLLMAYDLMRNDETVLQWLQCRYRYIMVDEYQDTNYLQRDIIYLLVGERKNLVVVGDDDQSIYAFRGARPDIMLHFMRDFPNAEFIYMTTNYRSDRYIIQTAGKLIGYNSQRFAKDFIGCSEANGKVTYRSWATAEDEMKAVSIEIKNLITEGVNPNEIAVLYRTNAQATPLAEAFQKYKIPFYSNETLLNRYQSWMYQDLEAYIKMANGEGTQHDYILTTEHPKRWLYGLDITETGLDERRMINALYDPDKEYWKNKKMKENVRDYLALLALLKGLPLPKALLSLGTAGKYRSYLKDYAEYRGQDEGMLLMQFESYIKDVGDNGLNTLDEWRAWIKEYNKTFSEIQKNQEGVCLSTMHMAKGLEWDYVFIIGCEQGKAPLSVNGTIDNPEEERRLFYVAMTRARHELRLNSYASMGGQRVKYSPYLKESGIVCPQNAQANLRTEIRKEVLRNS